MDKGGKRCLPGPQERPRTEGKRTFAHLTRRSGFDADMQGRAQGVRYVQCAAKGTRGAAGANPNEGASAAVLRPEGVRITRDAAGAVKHGQVRYKAWQPPTLAKAEGGDWNLNTRYGNRKVGKDATGRPMREAETPIAWPSYAAYPPDRDARTALLVCGQRRGGAAARRACCRPPRTRFGASSRDPSARTNSRRQCPACTPGRRRGRPVRGRACGSARVQHPEVEDGRERVVVRPSDVGLDRGSVPLARALASARQPRTRCGDGAPRAVVASPL